VAFIEGEGKEVSACSAVPGRSGSVLECRNLSLEVSQVRSEDKMDADLEMVTLLVYHNEMPLWTTRMKLNRDSNKCFHGYKEIRTLRHGFWDFKMAVPQNIKLKSYIMTQTFYF
jgi:hypothetical protein